MLCCVKSPKSLWIRVSAKCL
uniref:Uncharacterized protein n=1 Tax=Anguilla anguilla TaxID=7936 RepID=A0A0E9XK35_ANGAN